MSNKEHGSTTQKNNLLVFLFVAGAIGAGAAGLNALQPENRWMLTGAVDGLLKTMLSASDAQFAHHVLNRVTEGREVDIQLAIGALSGDPKARFDWDKFVAKSDRRDLILHTAKSLAENFREMEDEKNKYPFAESFYLSGKMSAEELRKLAEIQNKFPNLSKNTIYYLEALKLTYSTLHPEDTQIEAKFNVLCKAVESSDIRTINNSVSSLGLLDSGLIDLTMVFSTAGGNGSVVAYIDTALLAGGKDGVRQFKFDLRDQGIYRLGMDEAVVAARVRSWNPDKNIAPVIAKSIEVDVGLDVETRAFMVAEFLRLSQFGEYKDFSQLYGGYVTIRKNISGLKSIEVARLVNQIKKTGGNDINFGVSRIKDSNLDPRVYNAAFGGSQNLDTALLRTLQDWDDAGVSPATTIRLLEEMDKYYKVPSDKVRVMKELVNKVDEISPIVLSSRAEILEVLSVLIKNYDPMLFSSALAEIDPIVVKGGVVGLSQLDKQDANLPLAIKLFVSRLEKSGATSEGLDTLLKAEPGLAKHVIELPKYRVLKIPLGLTIGFVEGLGVTNIPESMRAEIIFPIEMISTDGQIDGPVWQITDGGKGETLGPPNRIDGSWSKNFFVVTHADGSVTVRDGKWVLNNLGRNDSQIIDAMRKNKISSVFGVPFGTAVSIGSPLPTDLSFEGQRFDTLAIVADESGKALEVFYVYVEPTEPVTPTEAFQIKGQIATILAGSKGKIVYMIFGDPGIGTYKVLDDGSGRMVLISEGGSQKMNDSVTGVSLKEVR